MPACPDLAFSRGPAAGPWSAPGRRKRGSAISGGGPVRPHRAQRSQRHPDRGVPGAGWQQGEDQAPGSSSAVDDGSSGPRAHPSDDARLRAGASLPGRHPAPAHPSRMAAASFSARRLSRPEPVGGLVPGYNRPARARADGPGRRPAGQTWVRAAAQASCNRVLGDLEVSPPGGRQLRTAAHQWGPEDLPRTALASAPFTPPVGDLHHRPAPPTDPLNAGRHGSRAQRQGLVQARAFDQRVTRRTAP